MEYFDFVVGICEIPSFLPSFEIQYDQIPFTRLGVAETLLGLENLCFVSHVLHV